MSRRSQKKKSGFLSWLLLVIILLMMVGAVATPPALSAKLPPFIQTGLYQFQQMNFVKDLRSKLYTPEIKLPSGFSASDIPDFKGEDAVNINKDNTFFSADELENLKEAATTNDSFIHLSDLDALGRCGSATALITKTSLPTEERGEIGSVKPSGWHTVKYPGVVEGNYLYNRCHLIAYCLCGLNAEPRNLITGTRWFNVKGMLPYEEMTVKYVEQKNVPVLYRVTPVFEDKNLVAKGVLMEAVSADGGLKFCKFVYNVQPGVEIDYATGESWLSK